MGNIFLCDFIILRYFVSSAYCSVQTCFDFLRCSALNQFALHVTKPHSTTSPHVEALYTHIKTHHTTTTTTHACLNIHIIDLSQPNKRVREQMAATQTLHDHNNMLVLLGDNKRQQNQKKVDYCKKVKNLNSGRALLVLNQLCPLFRSRFDFLLPDFDMTLRRGSEYKPVPLYPIGRKYLLTFASQFKSTTGTATSEDVDDGYMLNFDDKNDIAVQRNCDGLFMRACEVGMWCTCQMHRGWREDMLRNSLFTLVIVDRSNPLFLNEIIDAYAYGVIPVVVGEHELLPFSDVVDWKSAAVLIPSQRLPELELTLRAIAFDGLVALKMQGNFIYETYFSSPCTVMSSTLAYLRHRIGLPPQLVEDFRAILLNKKYVVESDLDPSAPKLSTRQQKVNNNTYSGPHVYSSWNTYPGGLRSHPVTPWIPPPPSRVQFIDEG